MLENQPASSTSILLESNLQHRQFKQKFGFTSSGLYSLPKTHFNVDHLEPSHYLCEIGVRLGHYGLCIIFR